MIGDNETNFPYKLLLTNRQVANLRKPFANYLSIDINFYTQLSKTIQSGPFLVQSGLLGPLLKTGLPLIENVIKPLARSVLIRLGLTAAASAGDAGILKKILGSEHNLPSPSASHNATLIISNDEIEDTVKIVTSLEYSSLLLKGVTETFQNEVKEQKVEFLSMLSGTLRASLLENILADRGIDRAGKGERRGINRAGEGALGTRQVR